MRLLLACTIVVGLCACGTGADRASERAATEAVLRAKVTTAGALSASTTYTFTTGPHGASNCAAAAQTGNSSAREFAVRGPGSRAAPLYFVFRTVGYHGSTRYGAHALKFDAVLAVIDRKSVYFDRTPDSHISMTVNRDGSGDASFTSFVSPDHRILNGALTWSCETEPAPV